MKRRTFLAFILFAAVVFACAVPAGAAPAVSARCGILMDAATGRVLWEQRANEQSLIASTTKIMTGLLIAEQCDLASEVLVNDDAVGVEGSSIYLKKGEILTVEELLYGMMLHSGNDAAAALAIYCSGSLESFAELMNRKAEELGLSQTSFANPHGLDSKENYSTARDLAKLTCFAMENPVFAQVVSAKTCSVGERTFTNHNKLLWRYDGAIGVKTGYTKAAGRILVSCAERSGRRLIAVTISAPNDWNDHISLLNHGFSSYEHKLLLASHKVPTQIPVLCGVQDYVPVVLHEDLYYPLCEGEAVTFRYDLPVFVFAPVKNGEQAGYVTLLVDGKAVHRAPLYWRYAVAEEE